LSLHSTSHGSLGAFDHREHTARFRWHCHQLIATGYNRIRNERHSKSEEDHITQRLKEEIKAAQRKRFLPKWADRYFVTDQAPVSGSNRLGKDRPKIDLEIESTESRHRPVFHFEAKRLRTDDSHSVSEYVGASGLGSFLAELYARRGNQGGMLGYVQSESPDYWARAIQHKFRRDPKKKRLLTDDGAWTAIHLIPALDHTFSTRHSRPTLGNITIYHTLLDFRFPENSS